ncbi:hypothetical protein MHH60_14840 [Paenibacillus sp. FSL H7-0716]|uniref:Lipocalin-like domain-containing protein n=1 Tax=Paenibacillus odorifer TaxID=189426 RepID=A0AB36J5I6_9BACL|nr:hypothetical protein [Paenibacillus odorifer]OMD04697.1 hypothetical protein BJP49_22770 [Paenibacillus odorifer]OME09608.1 hypothetical protein BSK60_27630 [Paenibacillus odorifer]OME10413.1 hypothetical protein BSK47_30780 [Paenibacillus odorifer]
MTDTTSMFIGDWEIESFLPGSVIFHSPKDNEVLLLSRSSQILARVVLKEDNAVILKTEVEINIPVSGGKLIQFLHNNVH